MFNDTKQIAKVYPIQTAINNKIHSEDQIKTYNHLSGKQVAGSLQHQ